jgi:hypothetical protein
MIAAAVQWAEWIMKEIDNAFSGEEALIQAPSHDRGIHGRPPRSRALIAVFVSPFPSK